MLQKQQQSAQRPGRNLHVGLATSQTEVLEAQKLRYRVFADEMGARLTTRSPGVDRDLYDAFCEHLIVRDEDAGRIVGTYRILSPSAAREVGNYYSETEFDITRLRHLKSRMVEIGRSCIDADYRSGAVITLLCDAEFLPAGLHKHEDGTQQPGFVRQGSLPQIYIVLDPRCVSGLDLAGFAAPPGFCVNLER